MNRCRYVNNARNNTREHDRASTGDNRDCTSSAVAALSSSSSNSSSRNGSGSANGTSDVMLVLVRARGGSLWNLEVGIKATVEVEAKSEYK